LLATGKQFVYARDKAVNHGAICMVAMLVMGWIRKADRSRAKYISEEKQLDLKTLN
jgi:hypothetical protein